MSRRVLPDPVVYQLVPLRLTLYRPAPRHLNQSPKLRAQLGGSVTKIQAVNAFQQGSSSAKKKRKKKKGATGGKRAARSPKPPARSDDEDDDDDEVDEV